MTGHIGPAVPEPSDLQVDGHGGVAVIEIQRPPHNYFDVDLISRLADELDQLSADGTTRVVVLCAAGKNFCAGANLSSVGSAPAGRNLYDEAVRLFEQSLPLVAATQGGSIGGGLGLAMAADFRVAAADSWYTANFAQLGFHHGFGLSVTLPSAVGQQAAQDLLYTGRRVLADEAVRIGLCDRVVPGADLRTAAIEFAEQIASSAPLAVRSIRTTLRGNLPLLVRDAVHREIEEQQRLMRTSDFLEGVRAANERRPPRFEGR